jgi:hypothetical protein
VKSDIHQEFLRLQMHGRRYEAQLRRDPTTLSLVGHVIDSPVSTRGYGEVAKQHP